MLYSVLIIAFCIGHIFLLTNKLLDDAYNALKLSQVGVLANATVLVYAFFEYSSDNTTLFVWAGTIVLISLFRLLLLIQYKFNNSALSTQRWQQLLFLGVILSAISWGITPYLFFIPQDYLHQMVLIIIFAGLSAGSISSLAQIRINVQLFLIILVVPLIIQLLLQDTTIYNSIAAIVSFYLVLMLVISKKFNKNYVNAIKSYLMYEAKQKEFLESEQKFKAIFNSVPIGILFYDTNLIIQEVNDNFVDFIAAPRDFLIGLDLEKSRDRRLMSTFKAPLDGASGFYEGQYTTLYRQKDLWVSMSTSPLRDSDHNVIGAVGIIADITQRMNILHQMEHQASFDTLTNIPNRLTLLRDINKEIIRFQRHRHIFGILFLDLDHFKNINDSLGHDIGDKLLIQTAQRLQKAIRMEDSVARLGGDEFVVLLPDLSGDEKIAATIMEHVAHTIHEVLNKPFEIDGYQLHISSSIGATFIGSYTENADDLLKHADIAMYQAKKEGRNTTRFYQQKMDQWIKRRLEIENELRSAIANDELSIHYQPIIEFSSSRIIGAEALLRWNNSKLGEVFPDEFIPIAEESGLIISIGEWVLKTAVRQFELWQKQFPALNALTKIAVNVSVNQFNNHDFLRQVHDVLKNSSLPPQHLELELTESILAKNITLVTNKMQELRQMGVKLSIDDFGTGYSSLSYLKKLPFTTLKIDKSFTQDIAHDIDDKELISTIITIAENFNLEVVIEGVETYEQYLFVSERKATYMQGYYCSKPIDVKSFEAMLLSNNGICQIIDAHSKEKYEDTKYVDCFDTARFFCLCARRIFTQEQKIRARQNRKNYQKEYKSLLST